VCYAWLSDRGERRHLRDWRTPNPPILHNLWASRSAAGTKRRPHGEDDAKS
jgi:hypothetical protein